MLCSDLEEAGCAPASALLSCVGPVVASASASASGVVVAVVSAAGGSGGGVGVTAASSCFRFSSS